MISDKIRRVPLLSAMDPALLDRAYAQGGIRIKHYTKGATVHHQHEPCQALDVVLSGTLAAYSLAENGSAMNLFSFQQGSIIGGNLLFGDQNAYPLNIYSTTPCRLLRIDRCAVTEFLHEYSFVMPYIQSLSMNSQGMNRKITMLSQRTLRENLLHYLRQQSAAQETRAVVLPISKKELADYLGVQRPSLFRELKKLKDERVLSIRNRTVTLHSSAL